MTESEKLVYEFIKQGALRVDEEGKLWRIMERRGNRGNTPWRVCDPPRQVGRDNGHGYHQYSFTHQGRYYHVQISRIVYLVTHGTINDKLDVDHFNFIRSDNRPSNLTQMTHLANSGKSKAAGRLNQAAYAMYSDDTIREIRRRGLNERHSSLAVEFGCGRRHIDRICSRQQYAWVT